MTSTRTHTRPETKTDADASYRAAPLLIAASLICILLAPTAQSVCAGSSYVTYYSGKDAQLSLGGGMTTVRELLSYAYGNLTEEFSSPPYTTANTWASYNGWSTSGSCPCWWGTIWCGVTSDGYLQWHNWFHGAGGAIYDFKMWKSVNPGPYFEIYMPISSWREDPYAGVAGAPTLYIRLRLYDSTNTQIFMMEIPYNNGFSSVSLYCYGNCTSAGPGTLNLKLWQNSTGTYFSSDNGTTAVYLGTLYTPPSRLEIGFYIWEYNSLQPYTDREYYVNIDRIVLRPLQQTAFTFSGLPAGSWYLLDGSGSVVTNTSAALHGSSLSYINRPPVSDEFNDGVVQGWTAVNLASLTESGGSLYPVGNAQTWGASLTSQYAGALYTLWSAVGDFWIEAKLTYTWQSGALSQMYLAVRDASGNTLAYVGVHDAWAWDGCTPAFAYAVSGGSSWCSSENAVPASGTVILSISRTGSTWNITASGAYSGQWTTTGSSAPIAAVYLIHTRYYSYPYDIAAWDYVRTNIPGAPQPVSGALVGLVDYTYAKSGTFYANTTVTYSQDFNTFTLSNGGTSGLTIVGVPANDVVKVYQGTTLKKTVTSNGSSIVVSPQEISMPFNGSIVVVSRPYLRPSASYTGTLDWSDQLVYSGGALSKSSTGAQLQQKAAGSECDSTSGWTFTYNLISGGSTPSFYSSSGYVRFDESSLSYYYPGEPWDYAPVYEAYYYLEYPVGAIGRNFTVSVSADGGNMYYKWYSSSLGDWIYVGYGEVFVYLVSGGTQTLIAQSAQSGSPSLTATVTNISSSSTIAVDKIRIVFHTYGRGRDGYSLYMAGTPQWGRVDYLRISYSSIPDGYPGIPVTGLQQGWRVELTISGSTYRYWANSSGSTMIPLSVAVWPRSVDVKVYPPSECYAGTFQHGYTYYTKTTKTYLPIIDTLFYEIDSSNYTYRVELKLLSFASAATANSTGAGLLTRYATFTFKVYENGTLLPETAPSVSVDGRDAAVERVGDYTWRVRAPPGAFIEARAPTGISVSGTLP